MSINYPDCEILKFDLPKFPRKILYRGTFSGFKLSTMCEEVCGETVVALTKQLSENENVLLLAITAFVLHSI